MIRYIADQMVPLDISREYLCDTHMQVMLDGRNRFLPLLLIIRVLGPAHGSVGLVQIEL
jgi:hypothetical protein